ncbi:hypothetical protein L2E82_23081 [Cichorium intybus]|uniref:Uncharacterized protein n=1 Tax=Cichorium intybus TaxID=13427 RepID=A0ACB9DZB5_CICIN|nr:hypothetical protein L2E82_23081 [Cichorium intybus]
MHRNITNLKSVSELYLSNNNLTGPLPNLIGMNSLSYLDMSNNSFDPSDIPTWFTLPSLTTLLMVNTQLQGEIPSDVFQPQLQRLGLSNNALIGTLDVGNSYKNDLIVDLRNNSIADFTKKSGYSLSLKLANNPLCEGITGRYYFKNTTYTTILHDALTSAFRSSQLPVDSISISNPSVNEYSYLQYKLQVFPSGQDYFTRSDVSKIGTVINHQNLFSLSYFGPLFFLDDRYCCFPEFLNLAMRCVQDSGVDRPKMGKVVREIKNIIELAVLSLEDESASTFLSQNMGNTGDLYHPYGDSVSDASSLSLPFETEIRR